MGWTCGGGRRAECQNDEVYFYCTIWDNCTFTHTRTHASRIVVNRSPDYAGAGDDKLLSSRSKKEDNKIGFLPSSSSFDRNTNMLLLPSLV